MSRTAYITPAAQTTYIARHPPATVHSLRMSFNTQSTGKLLKKRLRTSSSEATVDSPGGIRPADTVVPNESGGLQTPPPSSPARLPAALHSPPSPPLAMQDQLTLRDVFGICIEKGHPDLDRVNLNDWEIMELSGGGYRGVTPSEIARRLKVKFDYVVQRCGTSPAQVVDEARRTLDRVADVTGLKPLPSHTRYVRIRPIADSDYSMRLWPGSITGSEWCLDFVHSKTLEPKNAPFIFELWAVAVGDPIAINTAPWLPLDVVGERLKSLEHGFGMKPEQIPEGEEKFVLRDGQTCMLKRPGRRAIRFTVPNRFPVAPTEPDDVEVVTF
ncbi:hypothetical protein BD413DRAFT_597982 [Trametes elegans]|nr:hypothetical protein BD413DRAFT_597982 [Trametes elegans]